MLKLLGLLFLFWILSGLVKLGIFVWRIKQQFKQTQSNNGPQSPQMSPLAEGAIEADQCPKCGVFGNQPCQNADCPK
jgi:hypothetical protein